MKTHLKKELIGFDSETLADALVRLSIISRDANEVINELIAKPERREQLLREKLAKLQSGQQMDDEETSQFAYGLQKLLLDIKAGIDDPHIGLEMITTFYEAAENIFGRCRSNGHVSNIYYSDAKELFVHFASLYPDKQKVADIVLQLCQPESRGNRYRLVACAGEYLPEEIIRNMIDKIQKKVDRETDIDGKRYQLGLIEGLAREIKEAKLFEEARIAAEPKLFTESRVDIARVYLESGDLEAARSWLSAPDDAGWPPQRDDLLEEVYRKQGDLESLEKHLFKEFRYIPTADTLQALLDVIGHEKRDNVISDQIKYIQKNEHHWETGAEFMIAVGKIDEAATYILMKVRADQIEVTNYSRQASIAEVMAESDRPLLAYLLYRIVFIKLMDVGEHYLAARYLVRLGQLSDRVTDWEDFDHHDAFRERIDRVYGGYAYLRFWTNYKEEKSMANR